MRHRKYPATPKIAVLSLFVAALICLSACKGVMQERSDVSLDAVVLDIMDAEIAEALYPASFNCTSAKEKGLISKTIGEENYQRLEAAYLAALNCYLEQSVDIKQYDEELQNSAFHFFPIEDNVYFRFRSYGRQNLYLRNNAYIERLSSEHLAILKQAITGDAVHISTELLTMISDTWKEVIQVYLDPADHSVYEINYEMDSNNGFKAYNDSLTFILGYCLEYDAKGNIISDEQEDQKYAAAKALCDKIEHDLQQALDCHVKVFILVGDKAYENK